MSLALIFFPAIKMLPQPLVVSLSLLSQFSWPHALLPWFLKHLAAVDALPPLVMSPFTSPLAAPHDPSSLEKDRAPFDHFNEVIDAVSENHHLPLYVNVFPLCRTSHVTGSPFSVASLKRWNNVLRVLKR
jgi:hypothetical protein